MKFTPLNSPPRTPFPWSAIVPVVLLLVMWVGIVTAAGIVALHFIVKFW